MVLFSLPTTLFRSRRQAKLLTAMIDVDPITGVELFEAHLTGAAAKEFQKIVYKVSEKLYDSYIDVEFNMIICRFTSV